MKFTAEQIQYLERNIEMDGLEIMRVGTNIKGNVCGSVYGDVEGSVGGSVYKDVEGTIGGDVYRNVFGDIRGSVQGRW